MLLSIQDARDQHIAAQGPAQPTQAEQLQDAAIARLLVGTVWEEPGPCPRHFLITRAVRSCVSLRQIARAPWRAGAEHWFLVSELLSGDWTRVHAA